MDGLRSGAAAAAPTSDAFDPRNPFQYPYDDDDADPLAHLTVFLAVRLDNPQYRGATKEALGDERARALVHGMVAGATRVGGGQDPAR